VDGTVLLIARPALSGVIALPTLGEGAMTRVECRANINARGLDIALRTRV